jgi:spore germination cell wall hydrolase CwlJ-like protein
MKKIINKFIPRSTKEITLYFLGFLWLFLLYITLDWIMSADDYKEQKVEIPREPQTEMSEVSIAEPEPAELSERDRSRVNGFEKSELLCLSLNVYHESRSDNLAGRISVADVVLNRVDSTLFPNTVCGVVHQAKTRVNWKGNVVPVRGMCHFSWYCDGMSDEPLEEDAWEDAQIVAELALNGGWRGISEGATHYHATYVEPNWINDRGMVPVGRIGEHKFYRWH